MSTKPDDLAAPSAVSSASSGVSPASVATTLDTNQAKARVKPSGASERSLRLEYLDGFRALASLYVVLFHAGLGFSPRVSELPGTVRNLQRALSFGHDAVAVFIVLSGYCLMLPVARAEGRMKRGLSSYFARRAWRILPPYFATLLGTLSLLALVPILETPTKTIWDDTSPAFAAGPLLSHLLLVHNFFPDWAHRINGPLWSVATEWQIYFFFPLLLLPVWQRFGLLTSIVVSFIVGCSLIWIAPGAAHSINSWYLGLFALGMGAAGIGFVSRAAERALRERAPWGVITLSLLACVALGITVFIKRWFTVMPLSDSLVGAATAAALVYLTQRALRPASEPRPLILRALESGPLVFLGRFSYSLYLTHLPVVALCYFALASRALSPGAEWLSLVLLSLPASVLFSFGFFWFCERRFVGAPPARFRKRVARAAPR